MNFLHRNTAEQCPRRTDTSGVMRVRVNSGSKGFRARCPDSSDNPFGNGVARRGGKGLFGDHKELIARALTPSPVPVILQGPHRTPHFILRNRGVGRDRLNKYLDWGEDAVWFFAIYKGLGMRRTPVRSHLI